MSAHDPVEHYRQALDCSWNRRDLVWTLELTTGDFEFGTAQLLERVDEAYAAREGVAEFACAIAALSEWDQARPAPRRA